MNTMRGFVIINSQFVIVTARLPLPLLVSFDGHFDAALHVEVTFGDIIMLAIENLFEAFYTVIARDIYAFHTGEHLGHVERLARGTSASYERGTPCLSSGESSSMPRMAMMSCKSL